MTYIPTRRKTFGQLAFMRPRVYDDKAFRVSVALYVVAIILIALSFYF